jgi:atypical dual specificity phosphatase
MGERGDILRKLYGFFLGHPMNFSFLDENVAGSARPMSAREVRWLERKGIGSVLSLTEEPLKKPWVEGLDYLNIEIKNHTVPTLDQISKSIEFIQSSISGGKKVVVHCAAGKGRTGTILAAYWSLANKIDPKSSIAFIRSKRPGSIEKKQQGIVFDYYEQFVREKAA